MASYSASAQSLQQVMSESILETIADDATNFNHGRVHKRRCGRDNNVYMDTWTQEKDWN